MKTRSRQIGLDLGLDDPDEELSTPGHDALLLWCKRNAVEICRLVKADRPDSCFALHVPIGNTFCDFIEASRFRIEVPVNARSGPYRSPRREGFIDCVIRCTAFKNGFSQISRVIATKAGKYAPIADLSYGQFLFNEPTVGGFSLAKVHANYPPESFRTTKAWSSSSQLPDPHPASLEYPMPKFGPVASSSGGRLIRICEEFEEREAAWQISIPIEIKTNIPSLGDLIRQLQRYRGGVIDDHEAIRSIVVVSPDDRWREEIVEQGFSFVSPADIDPNWGSDGHDR